jgi:hypothetical protein
MTEEITTQEVTTEADVAAAEAEAAEAEALVAALEKSVIDGDDSITPDQLTTQEGLSRFARLRAEATRRKAARSKEAARLAAANGLREEMEAYAFGSGKALAKRLRAVAAAEEAFLAAAKDHNGKVMSWLGRAEKIGIPESDMRPVPPAEDGRLAIGRRGGTIHVGRRLLEPFDGLGMLKMHRDKPDHRSKVYENLEGIDAELPNPTSQHFYRGAGGAIVGVDIPFTPDEVKRNGLTKLTRKQAWGE